jgi:hypothetical protein
VIVGIIEMGSGRWEAVSDLGPRDRTRRNTHGKLRLSFL